MADNYAQQLMDQYGSTYTANGIGLETLKAFERIQLKHTLLLTLVYGPDGESPVDDSDLTEHLDSQMYELAYVNIPLYNTSTFVFASDDQKAQMLQLAQAAAAICSETQDGSVSEQVSALHSAASAALPDIYAVLDSTPAEDASSVQTELLTESDLTNAFTQDGAADAVRGLVYGEAAAVQYNAASIILMMRIDPLQVSTLDALRTQILSDMKMRAKRPSRSKPSPRSGKFLDVRELSPSACLSSSAPHGASFTPQVCCSAALPLSRSAIIRSALLSSICIIMTFYRT